MEARSPIRRLGPAAVVLTLLLAACAGRGPIGASPAAQIGDRVVSISDLDRYRDATRDAVQTLEDGGSGQVMPGAADQFFGEHTPRGVPSEGVRTVLTELIHLEIMKNVADDLDVEIDDGDRDMVRAQIPPEVLEGLPDDYLDVQLELGAYQQALSEGVDVDEAVLRDLYEQQKGDYTQVCLQVVGLPDEATAHAAAERYRAGEPFEALFEELNVLEEFEEEGGALPCSAAADLEPSFGPAIYEVATGDTLEPLQADEERWMLAVVDEVDEPGFDDLQGELRPEAARIRVDELVNALLDDVRVNPRFGTWNAETGTIDPVASASDAGDTPELPQDSDGSGVPVEP